MVWVPQGHVRPGWGYLASVSEGIVRFTNKRHACARRRARRAFDGGGLPSDALIEGVAGLAASFGHPI